MADTKVVNAKKQVSLEDIKFNEANKTMAILSWIPIVGLIMFFVEKEDSFVRYVGAQATLLGLTMFVGSFLSVVPVVGWCVVPLLWLGMLGVIVYGMVQTSKGERFDLPVLSGWAVSLMNSI